MRKIDLSKQARDFLQRLPAKHALQIAKKVKLLAEDAEGQPTEMLKGYAPMRRLRAGEYRIVYLVAADVVKIALVGKRNDDEIYKLLGRLQKK